MEFLEQIWKFVIGLSSASAAVATAWWTVNRWIIEREDRIREQNQKDIREYEVNRRQSQRPFLEKQLTYYFEATKVAAQIATLSRGDRFDEARQKFWEMYYGELSIVENDGVAACMVGIGESLNLLEEVWNFKSSDELSEEKIKNVSEKFE